MHTFDGVCIDVTVEEVLCATYSFMAKGVIPPLSSHLEYPLSIHTYIHTYKYQRNKARTPGGEDGNGGTGKESIPGYA